MDEVEVMTDACDGEKGALPLVTFALFAYNQEDFIVEAVQAALAQDYSPLQIILSDDGSSDSTFSKIQSVADHYDGPHEVVVRQSEINLGTAAHVQAVAKYMSGDLLVVAAGDDISLPDRVGKTVEAWLATDRMASVLHGKMIEIRSDTGVEIKKSQLRKGCDKPLDIAWYVSRQSLPFFSPTCAYSRRVFDNYPALIGGSVIEDGVLVQRCFLEGPVVPVPHYLIQQRVGHESSGRGFRFDSPHRWNRHMRSRTISALNRLQDLAAASSVDPHVRRKLERAHLRHAKSIPTFTLPLSRKLGVLARMMFAIKLMMRYPTSAPVLGRVLFALRFTNLAPGLLK